MPTGNQQSLAPGIALQPTTPGTTEIGNGHVNGNFLAGRFVQSYGGVSESLDNCLLGKGWNVAGVGPNCHGSVGIGVSDGGSGAQIVDSGNVNQPTQGCVAIGKNAAALNDFCVAIGSGANASSFQWGTNDTRNGKNIAIGPSALAQCTVRTVATPNSNIAIGGAAWALGGEWSISIGYGTQANGTGTIAIGSRAVVSGANSIGILTNGSTVSTANTIAIGDATHTKITIGGVSFTNAGGDTRLIADLNSTVTRTDSALLYSSITAARTVTLPAANAVPLGFRILVADESGNASGVNTITINRAGADTINGGASTVINTAFGVKELVSDGSSRWTIIRSL